MDDGNGNGLGGVFQWVAPIVTHIQVFQTW